MKKSRDLKENAKKSKRSMSFLPTPWKAVSMTRIRRMDVADVDAGDAVKGYLVDEEGNPVEEPKPWYPVYLRGLSKTSHPKWNVATAETAAVIYKDDGWDIILSSGDRLVLKEIDRGFF